MKNIKKISKRILRRAVSLVKIRVGYSLEMFKNLNTTSKTKCKKSNQGKKALVTANCLFTKNINLLMKPCLSTLNHKWTTIKM